MTRRLPILPTIVVAAAVLTMIGLGVWQLGRAEWKADLLARYSQAQAMSSDVPWPRNEPERERSLFRWSGFTCERVLGMRSGAGTSAQGVKGWQHIARCAIDGGGEAEVALVSSHAPWALIPAVSSRPRKPLPASSRWRHPTLTTCRTTTSLMRASGSSSR